MCSAWKTLNTWWNVVDFITIWEMLLFFNFLITRFKSFELTSSGFLKIEQSKYFGCTSFSFFSSLTLNYYEILCIRKSTIIRRHCSHNRNCDKSAQVTENSERKIFSRVNLAIPNRLCMQWLDLSKSYADEMHKFEKFISFMWHVLIAKLDSRNMS